MIYVIFRRVKTLKNDGGVALLKKKNVKTNLREEFSSEFEKCIWCHMNG